MFSLLPRFVALIDDFWVGQDMAVSAEALRLWNLRLKGLVSNALILGTRWKWHNGCDRGKCRKKYHEDQISIAHAKVLPLSFEKKIGEKKIGFQGKVPKPDHFTILTF
jgi:hypothetical protein